MSTTQTPYAQWHPLSYGSTRLTGGLWRQRQSTNRSISLRHGYEMLNAAGNFHNLRLAAGLIDGQGRGPRYMDSDLYKWLEALAYELGNGPDDTLQQMADETIDLIAAAQESDGYINSYFQIVKPESRWADLQDGHELYCAGHLIEAAVAHHRIRSESKLLDVARRFADYIDSRFGPGKQRGTPGHPEIELALVKLYHVTGERRYLELSNYFLTQRGNDSLGSGERASYYQDRVPVREAVQIEGHAVRALYLASGMTDVYMETGEQALLDAALAQWRDMTSGKLFITGGLGSRHEGESFGEPYELPNDRCYCETCAAIASIFWNWRLLQITGDGRYADLMERTMYNGFLSGVSLDGTGYFYVNPLLSRDGKQRPPWHGCACCPPNVMRMLSSIGGYFATGDPSGLQIHHYAPAVIETALESGENVALRMEAEYPWQGEITVTVERTPDHPWRLQLRIPGWCASPTIHINDQQHDSTAIRNGYVSIERAWQSGDSVTLDLPMAAQFIEAHPRVDPTRGSLALQRGPIIYCLERADQNSSVNVLDVQIDAAAPLETQWKNDVLGGTIMIRAEGYTVDVTSWGETLYRPVDQHVSRQRVSLNAIPYHLWANREPGAMRVWIPRA